MNRFLRSTVTVLMAALLGVTLLSVVAKAAAAASPVQLDLSVLLIGTGPPTRPRRPGSRPSPRGCALHRGQRHRHLRGRDRHPSRPVQRDHGLLQRGRHRRLAHRLRLGPLTALDTYESTFGVSQVDGYMYPSPTWG